MSDDAQVIHQAEAMDLVSNTAVGGVFFGIGFTLYWNCVQLMIIDFRKGDRRRQTAISFVFSSLIVLCGGGVFATNVQARSLAYIDHNDTLDAPFVYLGGLDLYDPSLYILNAVFPLILHTLMMAMEVKFPCVVESNCPHSSLQLWRIWVIWTESSYAILVTLLSLVVFLVNQGGCSGTQT
jgi:hypothetical protein